MYVETLYIKYIKTLVFKIYKKSCQYVFVKLFKKFSIYFKYRSLYILDVFKIII